MTNKDAQGNTTMDFPITKAENVEGLEDMLGSGGGSSMPSDSYINVSGGKYFDPYTAPCDGYLVLDVEGMPQAINAFLYNQNCQIESAVDSTGMGRWTGFIPLAKGQIGVITINTGMVVTCRFIYAQSGV